MVGFCVLNATTLPYYSLAISLFFFSWWGCKYLFFSLQDCVKYLALLLVCLSVSMVSMADDSSEEDDEDENEVQEVETTVTEATVPVLRQPPSASSTVIQSGPGSVTTVTQTGGSNVVVSTYDNRNLSKTASKAKATAKKIAKKVNRIVSFHRQRFTFYRCQTSCLVSAISCLNTCRTQGAYTFYRNQYMVCGRKCRLTQYKCNKTCSNDLMRVRTEQLRALRS